MNIEQVIKKIFDVLLAPFRAMKYGILWTVKYGILWTVKWKNTSSSVRKFHSKILIEENSSTEVSHPPYSSIKP